MRVNDVSQVSAPQIIITSINRPTKSVLRWAELFPDSVIVIGDVASPDSYDAKGVSFYSLKDQEKLPFQLCKAIPTRHYARKMIGYLLAADRGCDFFIDTDDDNIPYDDFSVDEFDCINEMTDSDLGFVNIYREFTDEPIWPRGMPLRLIRQHHPSLRVRKEFVHSGVIQGLANGSPDVDAIYRLTNDRQVIFKKRSAISLGPGTWSPFNSQNTAFRRELLPLMYLPVTVSFRYTDILRSLVAQPIMWNLGYVLTFSGATVFQERNAHDYLDDFVSEIPMYTSLDTASVAIADAIQPGQTVTESMICAYNALEVLGVVTDNEVRVLRLWLADLSGMVGSDL